MKTISKKPYKAPDSVFFEIGPMRKILSGSYSSGGGGKYDPDDINDNGEY